MNGDFVLTKALAKEFASLDDAKGRRRSGMFVAEGRKCVETLIDGGFSPRYLFADVESDFDIPGAVRVKRGLLRDITRLSATPQVIAFFELPDHDEAADPSAPATSLVLALDRIQDPGNMGTILRTADWMGVRTVVASRDTVDIFNPKTVQASMGAIASVKVVYTDLAEYLGSLNKDIPVYGTFLDGADIYSSPLSPCGVVVMGNEGSGVSAPVAARVNSRLFIPPFGDGCVSESLNVSIATAVVLSQFRQRLSNG